MFTYHDIWLPWELHFFVIWRPGGVLAHPPTLRRLLAGIARRKCTPGSHAMRRPNPDPHWISEPVCRLQICSRHHRGCRGHCCHRRLTGHGYFRRAEAVGLEAEGRRPRLGRVVQMHRGLGAGAHLPVHEGGGGWLRGQRGRLGVGPRRGWHIFGRQGRGRGMHLVGMGVAEGCAGNAMAPIQGAVRGTRQGRGWTCVIHPRGWRGWQGASYHGRPLSWQCT